MSDENKKYVPEGVFLVCDMGATPSQLIATPRKVNLYGPMMATDMDNKFTTNILPFGACKKIGGPCAFACVEWTKTKSGSVFTNGQKPLLEDSEALCSVGQGKIKIFFDKYEADLANENNNESAFVSEEISSNIIGQALTSPFGNIIDLFCDDDKKFTEGVGRGFKQGLEGTWNFLTDDMWKGETWVGLGKMAVIGAAYSGPTGPLMGDTNLQAMDQVFGSDFKKTKDALVEGVANTVDNAIEDVKHGETGEVGESVGQIYYAVVEAVVGSKGAGLVAKGLTTGAKALIGAERLASLSAKISKFANALKQGILKIVKVGRKNKPTFIIGSSDGGPGTWQNRFTPTKGAAYQQKVTGAPNNTEYVVDTDRMISGEKKFDGFNPETNSLIDAKDWDKWPPHGQTWAEDKVAREIQNDLDIANDVGSKLEYHVPTQAKADQIMDILDNHGIEGVTVKVTPK